MAVKSHFGGGLEAGASTRPPSSITRTLLLGYVACLRDASYIHGSGAEKWTSVSPCLEEITEDGMDEGGAEGEEGEGEAGDSGEASGSEEGEGDDDEDPDDMQVDEEEGEDYAEGEYAGEEDGSGAYGFADHAVPEPEEEIRVKRDKPKVSRDDERDFERDMMSFLGPAARAPDPAAGGGGAPMGGVMGGGGGSASGGRGGYGRGGGGVGSGGGSGVETDK